MQRWALVAIVGVHRAARKIGDDLRIFDRATHRRLARFVRWRPEDAGARRLTRRLRKKRSSEANSQ
jgi:hypothetical protein